MLMRFVWFVYFLNNIYIFGGGFIPPGKAFGWFHALALFANDDACADSWPD